MDRSVRAPDPSHPFGVRLKDLRERLGLTQEALAQASDLSDRSDIARLEGGWNKGSGAVMRRKLAKGLGLSLDTAYAYLDGEISLDEALVRRAARPMVSQPQTEG